MIEILDTGNFHNDKTTYLVTYQSLRFDTDKTINIYNTLLFLRKKVDFMFHLGKL